MLPEHRPGAILLNRLWPLLLFTLLAGGLAFLAPQIPGIAAGFAIIWSLAWRRQHSAVAAIEERDGARFYVRAHLAGASRSRSSARPASRRCAPSASTAPSPDDARAPDRWTCCSSRSAPPPACARPTRSSPQSLRRAGAERRARHGRAAARGAHARAHGPGVGAGGAPRRARGARARCAPRVDHLLHDDRRAAVAARRARSASMRPRRATGPGATGSGSARWSAGAWRRRRCCSPQSEGGLARRRQAPLRGARALVVPVPVEPRARRPPGPAHAHGPARRATSPRSPTRPTRRRRASTACSPPGARARRGGEELVLAGAGRERAAGLGCASARRRGALGSACSRRRTIARCAARARVRVRAAARGLRHRAAGGARRRLPARHHAGARALCGAADRARARRAAGRRGPGRARCAPRSTTRGPTTRSARRAALAPFRRDARRPARRRGATAAPAAASCCELAPAARVGDVRPRSARRGARSRRPSACSRASRVRCASESITSSTPRAAAARAWTSERSRRSGLALISSIVRVRAAAANTASRSIA